MGGNIGGHHDSRYVDLLVAVALLAVIVAAYCVFYTSAPAPTTTAFIVPGQATRW